jgi:hypothetical protein
VEVALYEDATIANGSTINIFNNDRNSENISIMSCKLDPTISVAGNIIYADNRGLGGTNKLTGLVGTKKKQREILLKNNSTYVLKITAREDTTYISYTFNWGEDD